MFRRRGWYGRSINGRMQRDERSAVAVIDDNGAYRICGVPNDVTKALQARRGVNATGVVGTALSGRPVPFRNLTLSLADSAPVVALVDSAAQVRVAGSARAWPPLSSTPTVDPSPSTTRSRCGRCLDRLRYGLWVIAIWTCRGGQHRDGTGRQCPTIRRPASALSSCETVSSSMPADSAGRRRNGSLPRASKRHPA